LPGSVQMSRPRKASPMPRARPGRRCRSCCPGRQDRQHQQGVQMA
jgi:hypothetical protein